LALSIAPVHKVVWVRERTDALRVFVVGVGQAAAALQRYQGLQEAVDVALAGLGARRVGVVRGQPVVEVREDRILAQRLAVTWKVDIKMSRLPSCRLAPHAPQAQAVHPAWKHVPSAQHQPQQQAGSLPNSRICATSG
jgi:hypothetical protein